MEVVVWSGACVLVGLREVGVQDPVCGGAAVVLLWWPPVFDT